VNYPRDHAGLFREISSRGCVISEFPLGTEPAPYNFPRRNRIVSGLSLGAFVIEARQKSGALITADFALEQGREVFALPGRIDSPLSEGPIRLIRSGAKPVLSIEDILEEMPPGHEKNAPAPEILEPDGGVMDKDQSRVLEILACGEASFDEMIARSGRKPTELSRVLLSLQMRGRINEAPGKVYSLVAKKKGEEKRKVFA
ncbi:MAG: DNA-processing protein DprA, partial [Elusimicrobia bacterium]|nr:DNA-processing protein DprA [Elusimicrobiota bacterium]